MRRLRRGRASAQKHLLILGTLGLFSILTVGYAAFQTNILLTAKGNVRSATSYSVNDLKGLVVSSGDGLYVDVNEPGRYVYKGGNPNNYLTLNNETWRILSIEPDDTIKIIRDEAIGDIPWDPGYETAITGITNANSNTGTRYSSNSDDFCYAADASEYRGCHLWGSSSTTVDGNGAHVTTKPWGAGDEAKNLPTDEAYINVYLNGGTYNGVNVTGWYDTWSANLDTKIKDNYIVGHHFYNIGPVASVSGQLTATDIEQEKAYKWEGRVGLMTASEYVRASNNSNCTGAYAYQHTEACYNSGSSHNYLWQSLYQVTISSYVTSYSSYVLWAAYQSPGYLNYYSVGDSFNVRPVLYLSAGTVLQGYGTTATKYQIKV